MSPATLDPRLRNGIGASECAMLFGLSPFGGPLDLYLRIVHPRQDAATKAQRRGTRLEAYLAAEYADRHGLWCVEEGAPAPDPDTNENNGDFIWSPPTQRHPEHALLIASPDRVATRGGAVERLVEIKTARFSAGWLDPDESPDGVPAHYLLQVAHQLMVGVEWGGRHCWPSEATLVASVSHLDDYREYTIRRDERVEAVIIAKVEQFWSEHIEPRVPPPFDGGEAGDELLSLLYPADTRPTLRRIEPTDDAHRLMLSLREARLELEAAEKRAALAAQNIKDIIGENAGIEGDGWRCTWKCNRPSHATDWKAVAQALAPSDALIAQHTTTKPGARVFRPTFTESPK